MNKAGLVILLAILAPLTHFAHVFANESYKKQNIKAEIKYNLPSADVLKSSVLGYDHFIADLLWLQLIQYIGSSNDISTILPETFSLIDSITTLDPNFTDAYIFGAYALTDNKEFDKAVTILEKGIKNNPKEWYLPYQIGFLYYINKKNKLAAARYLDKAGSVEGAPAAPKRLAAMLYSDNSNDLDIKIGLWQSVYEKADKEKDKVNKEKAYKKLVEFKIEKDLQSLNEMVSSYNAKITPTQPSTNDNYKKGETNLTAGEVESSGKLKEFKQLIDKGYLKAMPMDPLGRPYMFNPDNQEITSFPLPWETK